MNPIRFHSEESPRRAFALPSGPRAALILAALAHPVLAADVNLTASNGIDTTSFNTNLSWSNTAIPATGHAYYVANNYNLRTPANGATDLTFAGDSLTITGASLVYKGGTNVNTITINNLTLNGSLVNNASNSSTAFNLAGSITIAGTGTTTIFSNNGTITITAPIAGNSGTLLLQTNNTLGRQIVLTGVNTYTGNINVTGASGAVLTSTGALAFKVGATGVNNTITGAVPFNFDGAFNIDLTTAGDTVGDHWTLVDGATLGDTYGANFHVTGFTENENFWTSADGRYQFNEATGVLTRISSDTDGDGLPDAWEMTHFQSLALGATDDPDGDRANNLLEYQSGTNPMLASSYPDADGDGLNDGWELYYFNNLAQTADGDADGDHNTNLAEQTADTEPNNAFSFPDTDGDGLNDGWEVFHFGSLAAGIPSADPDGDLFDNEEEMWSGTNPMDQISSPDTDNDFLGDGLPDGWEVKYFRVGNETLAEAIARQDANGDPDGDGVNNRLEFRAGTDPTSAASAETTLGYWRFEEMTAGEVPAGGNNQYLYPTSIQDSSVYGNHMMAWADYSRPNYTAVVPAATVPGTGASNTASLFFQRNNNGVYYIEAIFSTPTANLGGGVATLRNYPFTGFTVEASFNTNLTGQWQVPVCKLGNPVGGQPPFSIKIDTTNKLRAGLVDGSGVAREIIGTSTIAANSWYSTAVTATATELKLWLKKPGDAAYVLEGTVAISGAWHVPATGPLDSAWNIGQGMWNGGATDPFQGNIDEVRISAAALPETEFLFHEDGSPFQLWAAANIPDAGMRGETADPDGDGTSNLAEYRLGLNPMSGSSFFAGHLSGSTITWPAANGLQFTIQRSTTLGAWDTITTVTAIGATGTWTDPAPPAGRAFYRILFTE
ncbi:LamG domain-containing protein [Luteolibacter flavescens]|uniref:LamG domain-containing protein n=1 Tax=Luteolibacter flavescens TaxID=1859460 RepID=A0ABT3FP55_9BACT|nr:LamG domain-containing protein [Luteolibacter flavescens]MCW1885353.1 LamG domain-containing protein [Luteolibacter flavescens]